MNGFLKRTKDIPDMFWADFFLCAWVTTGIVGCVAIFLIALCGCAGGGGYYPASPVGYAGQAYPVYQPQFVQPIAPVPAVPAVYPNAQIDTRGYQRMNGSSVGQIRY